MTWSDDVSSCLDANISLAGIPPGFKASRNRFTRNSVAPVDNQRAYLMVSCVEPLQEINSFSLPSLKCLLCLDNGAPNWQSSLVRFFGLAEEGQRMDVESREVMNNKQHIGEIGTQV